MEGAEERRCAPLFTGLSNLSEIAGFWVLASNVNYSALMFGGQRADLAQILGTMKKLEFLLEAQQRKQKLPSSTHLVELIKKLRAFARETPVAFVQALQASSEVKSYFKSATGIR